MDIPKLRECDYFDEQTEMHYALLQSAENIGPNLHTHEFFEIVLLIDGQIRHRINGQQVTLRDGSMTLIRPNDAHFFRPIANQHCHIINLAIAPRAIYDLFNYLGDGFRAEQILEPTLPPTVHLAPSVKQQVQRKLEQLQQIPVSNSAERRTALRILLFELATQYFPSVAQPQPQSMPDWLRSVCAEMQKAENLAGGVPRMVALSAVSPEHLTRTVRKHLGQTPTAYVNQLRMTYAANLLMATDRPIVELSAALGIESLSHFYTLFKQHHNQSPRQFRLRHSPRL